MPCFTLRDNTERPVTVRAGTNTLLGLDPARIAELPDLIAAAKGAARPEPPLLWDGRAAERIADDLPRRTSSARRIADTELRSVVAGPADPWNADG